MRDGCEMTDTLDLAQWKFWFLWESLARLYGRHGWTTDTVCRVLLERHDNRLGSGAALPRDLDSCLLTAGQQTLFSMADQVRSWPATAFGIPHDSLIQTTPVFFLATGKNLVPVRQFPTKTQKALRSLGCC